MRLVKARVQNYRSVRDTGWFDVENLKTILVGPNEAGKSAVLQALQQLNPPKGIPGFDALRDYPRSSYNDITTGKIKPADVTVVSGQFAPELGEEDALHDSFKSSHYLFVRMLDNKHRHGLVNAPIRTTYQSLRKDLTRLDAYVQSRANTSSQEAAAIPPTPAAAVPAVPAVPAAPAPAPPKIPPLTTVTGNWTDATILESQITIPLKKWLDVALPYIEEGSEEEKRFDRIMASIDLETHREKALEVFSKRLPIFVLFNNYFRVRPLLHLEHLAKRLETNVLDDTQYDYGNKCLLALLGFTAKELSGLGKAAEPAVGNAPALKAYRDQLDKRSYQLNAASVRLTTEIRAVWVPDPTRGEADRLRVQADGQYLKVVVEDDLGVEIELDQRSEGFQWLVSFFVVFFAEAADRHENAILLLDEPGLSLHGLKQREFRETISRLSQENQTIYTTHSPFLVGPDELDLVRVVEMTDRKVGTKIHTSITAGDPAALLPLQEALGYDLAQSLFAQQRNLVLEGLTDYWYVEAISQLLRDSGEANLDERIALVPASNAGKVVYYATILHAQKLKVAALLDSDAAGDQAASQDVLVGALGNRGILRTKDVCSGAIAKPEIEDLLRDTLAAIARSEFGWDVVETAKTQAKRPIVDIFTEAVDDFSKYRLAKAFLKWARTHSTNDLTASEREGATKLVVAINKALK